MGKFDNVKKQFADFNLKKVEDAFLVSLDYDTKARAIAMCVLAWKNGIASALISTSTGGIDNVVVDVIFSAALVEKRTNTKISDELIEKSIIAALKDIKIDDIDITKTNDGVAVLNLNKNEIISLFTLVIICLNSSNDSNL